MEILNDQDIVYRLRKRAEIRRAIPTRKSVQAGEPDRIADLLEEAADELSTTRSQLKNCHKILIACADCGCAICTGGISVGMPPECECPQDPPGSAHHAECPQYADKIRFTVERPSGENGVWDMDGDWMPSPKCCDWCEEKNK